MSLHTCVLCYYTVQLAPAAAEAPLPPPHQNPPHPASPTPVIASQSSYLAWQSAPLATLQAPSALTIKRRGIHKGAHLPEAPLMPTSLGTFLFGTRKYPAGGTPPHPTAQNPALKRRSNHASPCRSSTITTPSASSCCF